MVWDPVVGCRYTYIYYCWYIIYVYVYILNSHNHAAHKSSDKCSETHSFAFERSARDELVHSLQHCVFKYEVLTDIFRHEG